MINISDPQHAISLKSALIGPSIAGTTHGSKPIKASFVAGTHWLNKQSDSRCLLCSPDDFEDEFVKQQTMELFRESNYETANLLP
jgi:hypothetical protein